MATAAQMRANRANALRSTGPRTAAGKARSSMNGLKHGLRSHLPIPETPELQGFRAALQMEWRPSSPEACALVETLAVEAWRFRYIDRLMEIAFRDPNPKVVVAKVFTLVRYWAAAAGHFYRALHRLDALPAGIDRQDFHVRTQLPATSIINNELRPTHRTHFAPPNTPNARRRPKPHFPAHRCRADTRCKPRLLRNSAPNNLRSELRTLGPTAEIEVAATNAIDYAPQTG